jgi:hypothetical protein
LGNLSSQGRIIVSESGGQLGHGCGKDQALLHIRARRNRAAAVLRPDPAPLHRKRESGRFQRASPLHNAILTHLMGKEVERRRGSSSRTRGT